MPIVKPMFAVPVAEATFARAAVNSELENFILEMEQAGDNFKNPSPSLTLHAGVFESHFDFLKTAHSRVQELRAFILSELGSALTQINGYSPERMRKLKVFSDSWVHVTRRGGFTILHTHPMASWSTIYCVNPGISDEDRPESGVLRFHNPHHYSGYFLDAGNQEFQPPYHHGTWSVRLQPGQLILFPSWLQHEVLPYFGDSPRITVACNFWFGWDDGRIADTLGDME